MSLKEKLKKHESDFTPKYPVEHEEIDYSQIPFLTKEWIRARGFNQEISHENLMKLPIQIRRFWYKIDLRYLDYEPPKFPEKDPISQLSETPPDLEQLIKNKDKRIKVKAMVLGEIEKEDYDESKNSF